MVLTPLPFSLVDLKVLINPARKRILSVRLEPDTERAHAKAGALYRQAKA
jgi:hypothetical protein